MNFQRVYAIAARKFSSLRRDKRMFGFIIIMPAIQILLFGIAIGQAPTNLDFAVINENTSDTGTMIVEYLEEGDAVKVHTEHEDLDSARKEIESGELWGALVITSNGTLEILLDNSNQQVSNTILVEVRNAMSSVVASQA